MIKKFIKRVLGKCPKPISFKAGYDLTDMPVVTLYQGDRKFNFILDTGSTECIIDSNVLSKIKHQKCEGSTLVYGIEGQDTEANGCIIDLQYGDRTYSFGYLIRDMKAPFGKLKETTGVTVHGILGSRFFTAFKYVLDFDELIAYNK